MTAATVPCPNGRQVEFVGSIYSGPVVMVTEHSQTFVTDPGRFGVRPRVGPAILH